MRRVTDDGGKVVFSLEAGTYQAKVSAKGYAAVTENVAVAGAAVSKSVALTEA